MDAERIAFPRGVNGLDKYKDRANIYKSATPMHVRGSLLYNFYIREKNIEKEYEVINEGDKIKFVYLKEPNLIKENCIAFISKIPEEFNLRQYVDYDTMFEKSFIEPLTTILIMLASSNMRIERRTTDNAIFVPSAIFLVIQSIS